MNQSEDKDTSLLRVSMVQAPIVWEDRAANLENFGFLLSQIDVDVDIAVLPETFSTGFSMNVGKVADTMDGVTVSTIKAWAATYGMAIAGSFIAREDGKYYNRAFFITPEGDAYYYDKRHLFRMGGEDKHFSAGDRRSIIPYKGWNICLLVCYDLRFPVWSRNVNNEYDLLIYVANWPHVRRNVWETLLQARAMENMAYVCGVNRTEYDDNGHWHDGHSLLLTPRGEVQTDAGQLKEVICHCRLKKSDLEELRVKFPAWKDADHFTIEP